MALSNSARRLLARLDPMWADSGPLGTVSSRASNLLRAISRKPLDPFAEPPSDPTVLDLNVAAPVNTSTNGTLTTTDRIGPRSAGLSSLRATVAGPLGVDPESGVLVTNGASGAYRAALDAFIDPGRVIVLLAPCSPLFARAAVTHRARLRWVPTRVENGRLRFDFDRLSRAMRGAAVVAVADPGNPLGVPLAADDADRLRWTAERSDVLIYVDETFARFRTDSRRLAELAPGRTLVAGSLAGHGLTDLRVGWLAGPPPLVQACRLAQTVSAAMPPLHCQQIARRVLTSRPADDEVVAVRAAVQDAADRLRAMGLAVEEPADGYFLWADVGQCGRTFAEKLLAAEGVQVGPGDRYGPGGERFIRLSAATEPGRLREGLNRLARFVGAPVRPAPPARIAPARRPAFSR